ncbi:MAG: calcium-translocating P-type ATPase, PMCA-type [Actinomycetota bacterium]|nr:calcium-translocating P-type ATPase, PMCA-type [Actinomycetota bacterium]
MGIKNKNKINRPGAESVPAETIHWHTKPLKEIEEKLNTSLKTGLSKKEAESKISKYGYNELKEKKGRSPLRIFISQFNDFMIWILIAAAFISGVIIQEYTDATVILFILILNSVLGFVQEYRAEKALQALKELSSPTALVIRGGQEKKLYSRNLVPGDIIKLTAGDLVPADCRVTVQTNLRLDESILTGESHSVNKNAGVLSRENVPLGDRENVLFSSTTVVRGRCAAVVTGTGHETEIGKIASMVQEEDELTPLQVELKTVGKRIGIICLAVSAVVFLSGILKGNPASQMFLVAVALAVASIPEGLPAIVTVSLAIGVQKMAKNNAIVRKLSSVETLGSVSVICTDKTGTLTENKMMVREIYSGLDELDDYNQFMEECGRSEKVKKPLDTRNRKGLNLLVKNAVLCNDAYYANTGSGQITGDPTEAALIEMGSFYSIDKSELEKDYPRKLEEPFDSERKMMTTINKLAAGDTGNNHKYIMLTKGAPEVILKKCTSIIKNDKIKKIDPGERDKINKNNYNLAGRAMRNLAFAFKYLDELPSDKKIKEEESGLVYLGMVGMIDPPRAEVYDAIDKCKRANIKIIMVTGDHKITASAIGQELGIIGSGDKILEGTELDDLSSEGLEEQIEDIRIFARVSPSHKVKIVEALKKKGHIVSMTGDGINDAPSLKKADIGVAMGISGTDVSKESSDMVLTDDNFATIVKAIKQGRGIYDNLKKFILFLLSCNISEVLLMFISILSADYIFYLITGEAGLLYIPLLPVQILWMNLITDGLPAMALGIDPPEKNIMDRKATRKKEQILSRKGLTLILWQGLILTSGALFIYFAGPLLFSNSTILHDTQVFQTCVFTTLVITQLLHTFNFRFVDKGIFRRNIFENRYLDMAVVLSILLQIAIIYTPWLQNIFKTAALNSYHWLLIAASSIIPVLLINFINELTYFKKKNS